VSGEPTTSVQSLHAAIAAEREALVGALDRARRELEVARRGPAPRIGPLAVAALAGFVLAGGLGATVRLLARRRQDRHERRSVFSRLPLPG
jgi:hypothetical protein